MIEVGSRVRYKRTPLLHFFAKGARGVVEAARDFAGGYTLPESLVRWEIGSRGQCWEVTDLLEEVPIVDLIAELGG